MKIAVVAPSSVPFVLGGAERLWNGLVRSINELTPHDAELVKLPTPERTLPEIVASYGEWTRLDLRHFDMVISTKYPAWMVDHPNHVVYLQHTLRGLYDAYPQGLGRFRADEPELVELATAMKCVAGAAEVPGVVEQFGRAVTALGPTHDAFRLPGPLAHELVHLFDRVALAPARIRRYFAISATVAGRRDYFPQGTQVEVVRHPSDLEGFACRSFDYFFTASRLDSPKRVDLLIEAMRHVQGDIQLRIAGTGPEAARLAALAADDPRIQLLGYVATDGLLDLYAHALAVPFVPADEDLGLVTLEAMCSSKAVVTTTDAGGPTELVVDGVNGLVTAPTPAAVGTGLARLAGDRHLARRLGETARRTGEGVTWRRTVAALVGRPMPARTMPRRTSLRRPPAIVVPSTFPVYPRAGGGQLRCFHLYGAMTERFDVRIVSLGGESEKPATYELAPGLTETVVPKSPQHERREGSLAADVGVPITDIVAGRLIEHTPAYVGALKEAARGAVAVLLAHPFMLPAVDRAGLRLPLVYDAHNAEFQLKRSILPESATGIALLAEVVEVEGAAVERACFVSVCSAQDATALATAYGVDPSRFVEVPNGVDADAVRFTPGEQRAVNARRWLRRFTQPPTALDVDHLALFSGSWHVPNIDAAEYIFTVAADMPDVLFLLMGTHGDYFGRWFRTPPNAVRLGLVTQGQKQSLLASAHVALNPMVRGSGTNLKIVEYFAAGLPVVSTELGARGLAVVDGEHLSVATMHDFPAAIEAALSDPEGASRRAERSRKVIEEHYDWRVLGRRLAEATADAVSTRQPVVGTQ